MSALANILRPIEMVLGYIIEFFYNWIPSYGIAIILLTITVRIVLLPLTLSQTKSMAKMQMLQPELKEIQQKYKGDPQKIQQETMEFYKKNNVNPLSGCLPLILQMPVFFALFQLLKALGINAYGGGAQTLYKFLWLDLTVPDKIYILPILMVVTMILSSKVTQTDATKTGMSTVLVTYGMPLVFGFISYRLQSGILVYWITTNIWSFGQQLVVNRFIKKEKDKAEKSRKALKEAETASLKTEKAAIKPKKKKRRK